MLNRFRAVAEWRRYWASKGEGGGGLVRFATEERVVPVAGISKGY
jgi:hypothetical protein